MTKKSFYVPLTLALAALLITGIPFFVYGEEFLSLPWWPAPLSVSTILAIAAVVTDLIYAPAPKGYRVYWDQKRMDINYENQYPVILKTMTSEGKWAKVRFQIADSGLVITDLRNGHFATKTKSDKNSTEDGLIQFPSGNFMVTSLPKHFRVTWSRETWVEDKEEKS